MLYGRARLAINELRKLNSATEAGIKYPSYGQRVVDAKVEIDGLLPAVTHRR